MDTSTRTAALRAAAKITLCMSIARCGGSVTIDETDATADPLASNTPTPAPTSPSSPSSPVLGPLAPDAAAVSACDATGIDGGPAIDDETFTCCQGLLSPPFGSADALTWEELRAGIVRDPSRRACCGTVPPAMTARHAPLMAVA